MYTNKHKWIWLLFVVMICAAQSGSSVDEKLWHYRNLGKAYYENPTDQAKAPEIFQKALELNPTSPRERLNYGLSLLRAGKTKEGIAELEKVQKQDPKLPHTWFNLGIVFRKQGEFEKAIPQFTQMTKLVPDEPVSHYNLGVLYKQTGNNDEARKQLEIATKLNPSLAAPHFQLYNLYRQAGRTDDAAHQLAEFQQLKKDQEGAVIPEDMEWSDYAEIYDPIDIKERESFPAPAPTTNEPKVDGIPGLTSVAYGDYDNDGLPDACVLTDKGPILLHNNNVKLERIEANLPAGKFDKALWIDYDHDYDLDLLLLGEKSVLLRNQGPAGFADHSADFPFAKAHAIDGTLFRLMADSKAFDIAVTYSDHPGVLYRDQLNGKYKAEDLPQLAAGIKDLQAADVNRDSWLDLVSSAGTLINNHGKLEVAKRTQSAQAGPKGHWIGVKLTGVKNLKLAYGAQVEIKAGASYQKALYDGRPLRFELGPRTVVDTVRVTWPNGLIQNEANQAADKQYDYKEAQRLSGSCPMIWTWDGQQFRFITDVLGVAPLGASSGDGEYFPVDHDEYVQIPAGALTEQNGRFNIRVTEELSEVSYLDQIQLLAVDHAVGTSVYTSERWKGPPFPDFKLYEIANRTQPVAARDGQGHDVVAKLAAQDHEYVAGFRHDLSGVAETHTLDLAFGSKAPGSAILVLNGWVDWADGSTFLGRAQEGKGGLIPPYLQAKDANGNWKTINEDMGMPDGKPKTIGVEVNFPSRDRELRIVTNLCVFWDEIFLGQPTATRLHAQPIPLRTAGLHFRGFSKNIVAASREQPEQFLYGQVGSASQWNQTPGLYTRYGDVAELITSVDDKLVVMGSGDEMTLSFDAHSLKPPAPGYVRDYLLKVDGWAKDRDANTAYGQTVEPLPFHGMSRYPYPANEHFPNDASHEEYSRRYNTRPAETLIKSLITSN